MFYVKAIIAKKTKFVSEKDLKKESVKVT